MGKPQTGGIMKKLNQEMIVGISAAVVFALIGCVMLYFGTYFYNKNNALRSTGVVTTGSVLRFAIHRTSSTDEDKNTLVVPVVRFRTADGKEITFEGSMDNRGKLTQQYDAGQSVEVVYDPKHPANAKINTFAEFWFAPLLLWIIGAAFIFFPPFTIWKYYRGTTARGNLS